MTAVSDAFNHLHAAAAAGRASIGDDWSSSIHRAKGLEATAVLVVADTWNELRKWCTVDRALRNRDKQDKCRLGFVAFSRAMELLCLACREPSDANTRKYLEDLGLTLLPRPQESEDSAAIAWIGVLN